MYFWATLIRSFDDRPENLNRVRFWGFEDVKFVGLDHFKSGNNKCFWGWPSSHNPSCGGPPLCGPDFAATATLFFSREQVGFFVLQLYITLLVLYQSSLDFFWKEGKIGVSLLFIWESWSTLGTGSDNHKRTRPQWWVSLSWLNKCRKTLKRRRRLNLRVWRQRRNHLTRGTPGLFSVNYYRT